MSTNNGHNSQKHSPTSSPITSSTSVTSPSTLTSQNLRSPSLMNSSRVCRRQSPSPSLDSVASFSNIHHVLGQLVNQSSRKPEPSCRKSSKGAKPLKSGSVDSTASSLSSSLDTNQLSHKQKDKLSRMIKAITSKYLNFGQSIGETGGVADSGGNSKNTMLAGFDEELFANLAFSKLIQTLLPEEFLSAQLAAAESKQNSTTNYKNVDGNASSLNPQRAGVGSGKSMEGLPKRDMYHAKLAFAPMDNLTSSSMASHHSGRWFDAFWPSELNCGVCYAIKLVIIFMLAIAIFVYLFDGCFLLTKKQDASIEDMVMTTIQTTSTSPPPSIDHNHQNMNSSALVQRESMIQIPLNRSSIDNIKQALPLLPDVGPPKEPIQLYNHCTLKTSYLLCMFTGLLIYTVLVFAYTCRVVTAYHYWPWYRIEANIIFFYSAPMVVCTLIMKWVVVSPPVTIALSKFDKFVFFFIILFCSDDSVLPWLDSLAGSLHPTHERCHSIANNRSGSGWKSSFPTIRSTIEHANLITNKTRQTKPFS